MAQCDAVHPDYGLRCQREPHDGDLNEWGEPTMHRIRVPEQYRLPGRYPAFVLWR